MSVENQVGIEVYLFRADPLLGCTLETHIGLRVGAHGYRQLSSELPPYGLVLGQGKGPKQKGEARYMHTGRYDGKEGADPRCAPGPQISAAQGNGAHKYLPSWLLIIYRAMSRSVLFDAARAPAAKLVLSMVTPIR